MVASTWAKLTEDLDAEDLAKLERIRDLGRALPDTTMEVTSSAIQFRATRVFASAYVKSHYLELGVDLTREASHPKLRTVFASSKRVFTHRLTFRELDQIDDAVADLLAESRETVGPGFRHPVAE